MIELRDLSFSYRNNGENGETLKAVNLKVSEGECIVLTGPSGCGKTTLTRVLNGLCPRFYGGKLTGHYYLDGHDTGAYTLSEIGRRVGSVFQDPRTQFFCARTIDEIVFSMEALGFSRMQMDAQLEKIMALIPIEHLLNADIQVLSSGEKQKVAIAAVCVSGPKVLVFDEPSANLDLMATEQLTRLLLKLKDQGHTIIISEHRLHYLTAVFDKMCVMKNGEVIRTYKRVEALKLTEANLDEMGIRSLSPPTPIRVHRQEEPLNPFAETRKLTIRKGGSSIIDGLNFKAFPKEVLAITGRNGVGKSTFCKSLTGAEKESGGIVLYHNRVTRRKERIMQSFFIQQETDYQIYAATVLEEIKLGVKKTKAAEAKKYMEMLKLLPVEKRHPASLSGGQKQRILIAAACLRQDQLLIFDEPTSGLDGYHMKQTAKLFKALAEEGATIVLITHDFELINRCAKRIYHIKSSREVDRFALETS